jgi:hypothetical protein
MTAPRPEKQLMNAGFGFAFSQWVVDHCRPGAGAATCRFLVGGITDGDSGLHCAKFMPGLVDQIERRIEADAFVARGDNCPGKPPKEVL